MRTVQWRLKDEYRFHSLKHTKAKDIHQRKNIVIVARQRKFGGDLSSGVSALSSWVKQREKAHGDTIERMLVRMTVIITNSAHQDDDK